MHVKDKDDNCIKALNTKDNTLISSYAELDDYIKKHNIKRSIKATDHIFRCVKCNQFILLVIGKEKRDHFKHNKGNEESKEKCIAEEKNQNEIKKNNILTNRSIIYINSIEQDKIIFNMHMPKSITVLLNEGLSLDFNHITKIAKGDLIDDCYILNHIASNYKISSDKTDINLEGFFAPNSNYCIFNQEGRLIREKNIIYINEDEAFYYFLIKGIDTQLKSCLNSCLNNNGNEYIVEHYQFYLNKDSNSHTKETFILYKININSLNEDELNILKLKEKYRVLCNIFYSIIFPIFTNNGLNVNMNSTEFIFYANKQLDLYVNKNELPSLANEENDTDNRSYTLAKIKYTELNNNDLMYFAIGLVNLDKEIFIQQNVNSTLSTHLNSFSYEIDDNFLYFTTYIEGRAIVYKADGTSYQRKLYCSDDNEVKYNRFNLNSINKIFFYQGLDLIYTYEQKAQEHSLANFNEKSFLQKLNTQHSNIKVFDIAPSIKSFYKKYPLINAFLIKGIEQKTLNQKQLRLLIAKSEYKNARK